MYIVAASITRSFIPITEVSPLLKSSLQALQNLRNLLVFTTWPEWLYVPQAQSWPRQYLAHFRFHLQSFVPPTFVIEQLLY